MQNLSGGTAVITGAASGIGLELAKQFGAEGMNLVLADVEAEALEAAAELVTSMGYEVLSFRLDVRNHDELVALEAAATKRFGNIHVLCNNAGVGAGGPVSDPTNLEAWRWTIDVNLWGVIYGCKVFLPNMLAHGEPSHIVNTASMAGLGAGPFMGAYNVSKYGVVALSETLAKEMTIVDAPVGVSVLCPAFVSTGIATSDRNMPDDVRGAIPERPSVPGEMQAVIEEMVAAGIDASVVARAVVDAVLADKFWILTHEETKPGILERTRQIVEGVNPTPGLGFES